MWIVEDSFAGTATSVRWDAAGAGATLSDGNRVASASNLSPALIGRGARSVTPKSSGKWYVELRSLLFRPDRCYCGFDIGADQDLFSAAPTDFIGPASMAATTPKTDSSEAVTVDAGGTPVTLGAGDAIALALDLDAGKLWIGALPPWNHAVSWHDGADPATGTGARFTGLPAGDYYLFCCLTANDAADFNSLEIPERARGRPPSGFAVW